MFLLTIFRFSDIMHMNHLHISQLPNNFHATAHSYEVYKLHKNLLYIEEKLVVMNLFKYYTIKLILTSKQAVLLCSYTQQIIFVLTDIIFPQSSHKIFTHGQ